MGIVIALLIALLVSFSFSFGNGKYTLASLVTLFFVLFLVGIASQYWLIPYGPMLWGVAWVPMIFIIIVAALLFSSPPLGHRLTKTEERIVSSASRFWVTFSMITWIVLTLLLIAAVIGYLIRRPGV